MVHSLWEEMMQTKMDLPCVHYMIIDSSRHGKYKLCGKEKDYPSWWDFIDGKYLESQRRGRANSPIGHSTIKTRYGSRIIDRNGLLW